MLRDEVQRFLKKYTHIYNVIKEMDDLTKNLEIPTPENTFERSKHTGLEAVTEGDSSLGRAFKRVEDINDSIRELNNDYQSDLEVRPGRALTFAIRACLKEKSDGHYEFKWSYEVNTFKKDVVEWMNEELNTNQMLKARYHKPLMEILGQIRQGGSEYVAKGYTPECRDLAQIGLLNETKKGRFTFTDMAMILASTCYGIYGDSKGKGGGITNIQQF